MNNENSGVVEDGQKEAPLNDSINSTPTNRQVADSNGLQGPKPPDSKTFQLQMDEVVGRIRVTEEKLKSLEKQVLASGCKINKSAFPIDKEKLHEELQDLRSQREKVIEERKQYDVELKGLNSQVQKKNDACTKHQAAVRYKSEARIDEAVRRLEHQMQAQQLKLSEEKRIVAEIDTLKRSKRSLNEYLVLKQQVDQMRNKQKHLRSQRDACVKRINGLKAKEEKVKNLLDSGDSRAEKEEAQIEQPEHLSPLLESLKKELNVLHNKKKELKAKFSKEKSDYYSAMREMKTHKQREEATRRKNEKQTMMKAVVSSRATRQLYEKEKSICDTLISHLEKLHTSLVHLPEVQGVASTDKEPLVSVSASADFSSCGEGMFLRRKSDADDLVGAFAGVHRTSRRGSRKGRRSSTKEAPRKLNLHPEVVEHLLTLGLSPPSTAADLPKVLEELHGKKEFYKNAPSSSSMWALASNDPMSPINEEAAPEFPTKFEEKDASKATEASVKTESTVEKVEDKEGGEHLHDIVSQLSSTEGDEVSCSKNCDEVNIESAEDLNSLVSERVKNVSEIEKAELEKSAASEPSTDQPAASGNSDESVEGIGDHKLTHTTKEPIPVVLSPSGDDLCDSNKVVKNISDFKNCSPVMKEKHESSTKDQMLSRTEKTDLASRENISTPLLQNSTSAEHPNFTSSSPHTTKLALDQNGLEAAYEKNSLKEGHNIVKIQCEKCRA